MPDEPDVTPSHLSWIVDGRSKNQKSTMRLYQLIYDYEHKLNRNAEHHVAAQELLGIAFSLWRAVFLSDTSDEFEKQTADLRKFMAALIADNTVIYNTDKNSRNWSFRYYLANATYRLEKLSKGSLALVDHQEISKPVDSEKQEWRHAHTMFHEAVVKFGALLRSS